MYPNCLLAVFAAPPDENAAPVMTFADAVNSSVIPLLGELPKAKAALAVPVPPVLALAVPKAGFEDQFVPS